MKREGFPPGQWTYQANSDRFFSRRDGEFTSGTRMKVKVLEVDKINMRVNFEVVAITGSTTKKKSSHLPARPRRKKQE